MYINDVHILGYVLIAFIGAFVGYFLNWANARLSEEKSVFCKEFFLQRKNIKTNPALVIVTALAYVGILYTYGFEYSFEKNLSLFKFLILVPMLISAFVIDYKLQIIPNRLNLTIFEIGLVFAFLSGIFINYNVTINMLLGCLVGGGIFLLITLLRRFDCR
ncbi:MAG: prepilin peptidase [Clostridia bacterium]|nr:prepilin peptidase [Clostridia bacterium]